MNARTRPEFCFPPVTAEHARLTMFGPDGNEELGDLAGKVAAWMQKADNALATANQAISDMVAARAEVKKLGVRLDKIVAAIGPKVEKL